jgi:hypothetical protein
MNTARLKVLGFGLLLFVSGLWGLWQISGRTAEMAKTQTAERLAWGQTLFEMSARLSQVYRSSALASAALDPSLAQALSGKESQPSAAAAVAAQRAVLAAFDKLPPALRRPAYVLLGTERGVSAIPTSGGEPSQVPDKNSYGLADAAQGGAPVAHALVDGKLFRVAAVAVRGADGSALGLLGAAFLLDDAFVAEQTKDLALKVTLLGGRSVVSSLPPDQRSKVAAVPEGAVQLGPRPSLGPIGLPIFVGNAALQVDKSFALDGAAGARVVLTAESAPLANLAGTQRFALFYLAAIVLLTVALILLGGGEEEMAAREQPARDLRKGPAFASSLEGSAAARRAPPAPGPVPSPRAALEPVNELAALAEPASPESTPSVSPEDFPFGEGPGPSRQPEVAQIAQQAESGDSAAPLRFAAAEPEPQPAPSGEPSPEPLQTLQGVLEPEPMKSNAGPEPSASMPFDAHEAAIPLPAPAPHSPPAEAPPPPAEVAATAPALERYDPFGPAPGGSFAQDAESTTVVASVPEQLLRAASRRSPSAGASASAAVPLPAPRPSNPTGPLSQEEGHLREIYQQFLATRAQCNESADGLTFEKFAAKLRKNKDQLIQKYSCRTVRFQVYVKEGKAALKASPIKD